MKLAVYSMTAVWVGGFYIFLPCPSWRCWPDLQPLHPVLGFDSPLMETPKDKVIGYCV